MSSDSEDWSDISMSDLIEIDESQSDGQQQQQNKDERSDGHQQKMKDEGVEQQQKTVEDQKQLNEGQQQQNELQLQEGVKKETVVEKQPRQQQIEFERHEEQQQRVVEDQQQIVECQQQQQHQIADKNQQLLHSQQQCEKPSDFSDEHTNNVVSNEKKKIYKKRRHRQVKVFNYSSSEDDNLPLSVVAGGLFEGYNSEVDITYKPCSKELNSTDSEFSSNLSEREKRIVKENLNFKGEIEKDVKRVKRNKNRKIVSKADRKTNKKKILHGNETQVDFFSKQVEKDPGPIQDIPSLIQSILSKSKQEAEKRSALLKEHYHILEQRLHSNGLELIKVNPYGNCFFEAASQAIGENPAKLRTNLCQHLIENLEEYIWFLMNTNVDSDYESYVLEYVNEIEKLKADGYWSGRAGDFLPLALSNWAQRPVRIFTSNSEHPVTEFYPTLSSDASPDTDGSVILLAHISLPGVYEHYDGCKKKPRRTIEHSAQEQDNELPTTADLTKNTEKDDSLEFRQSTSRDMETESSCIDRNENTNPNDVPTTKPATNTQNGNKTPTKNIVKSGELDESKETPKKNRSPRKAAKFITPVKKKLTRKRKATPETWKKSIRKKLRLAGQEYKSATGKLVKKRSVQPVNCIKCHFKCSSKVSEEERQHIFETFWSLDFYERQKDFVCSRIEGKTTKTYVDENMKAVQKKRMVSRRYYLDVGEERVSVCKKFICATLNVGAAYIDHAMKWKSDGCFKGVDHRGKHAPANKTKESSLKSIRNHIESFPKTEGHYTRKNTNREFLGADLNIPRMYDLYVEKCQQNEEEPVKISLYRKVFNEEYNLSFHIPKKDQCSLCNRYHSSETEGFISEKLKEDYDIHQSRKKRAREEKDKDKELGKTTNNTSVATFDLQSVLYTPCSLVSLMYYMRKLCCYNLSVYEICKHKGTCYVWSEVDGKRGSSEIATCLRLHLLSLPMNVENVVLYSDACGGQNRNQIIATCLLDAVNSIDHIKIIDHKFLESGHTQMECDSMHSAIEFAKKKTPIHVPSQWDTVINMARRKDPYTVVPIRFEDVIDFKSVKENKVKSGKQYTDTGKPVRWNNIRWLRVLKSDPEACFLKENYDEEFQRIKFIQNKRGRQIQDNPINLPKKYKSKIPISMQKKKDLMQLCRSGAVPSEYHDFYKNLPASSLTRDALPQPDILESDCDSGND